MARRSSRHQRYGLASELRARGRSWVEIAAAIRVRWPDVNVRAAMRIAHQWTQQEVADAWTCRWPNEARSSKEIGLWENWPTSGRRPSLTMLDKLAQLYQCDVADLLADVYTHRHLDPANDGAARSGFTTDPFHGFSGDGWEPVGSIGDDEDMDRRAVLVGLGGLVASTAIPALGDQRSRHVAPEVVDYFNIELEHLQRGDALAGPHLVMQAVVAHYHAVERAIGSSRGPLHIELVRVAASYAQFAGWLHRDAGDLGASTGWCGRALEMAHRCGDPHLVGFALTGMAETRVAAGDDGSGVVELADAALAGSAALAPKARAMALATAATGYSMMGDRDQVDRFHDQMARAIDDADDDWAWGNAIHIPGYVDARRATCYERLGAGAALEATTLFETAIGRQRSTNHRDGGVFRARQARAFLSGGEPAEAARCAVEAIAVLDQTCSATLKHELVDLRRAARIWRDTSDGQELVAVLDEVA